MTFLLRKKNLTATHITNYLIGPGWKSSEEEFRIKNMSFVKAGKPSQYNFQYVPGVEPDTMALKEVQEKVDVGSNVRFKGMVKKGKAIGSKNLRMLRSTICDALSTLFLMIWESEIKLIEDGKVCL